MGEVEEKSNKIIMKELSDELERDWKDSSCLVQEKTQR